MYHILNSYFLNLNIQYTYISNIGQAVAWLKIAYKIRSCWNNIQFEGLCCFSPKFLIWASVRELCIEAANGSGHTNPVYAKQNGPHQLHQQNGPHQLPHNQKVLLDVDPQHADTNTTKTIPTKPEPETSINLNKPPALAPAPAGSEFSVDKLSKKVNAGADNQKFILLSPMYGSKGNTLPYMPL